MRILVVDDEVVGREKLGLLLSAYGDYESAENGEKALEMFKHARDEGRPYDLITMDIEMPVMSGREAIAQMRAIEEMSPGSRAKILMVTVTTDVRTVICSFKNGCDGYIIKPFTQDKVREVLFSCGIKPKPAA